VAQVVKHLLSKSEALSSHCQKKKKKKKKVQGWSTRCVSQVIEYLPNKYSATPHLSTTK
jgi:hypothetical protein